MSSFNVCRTLYGRWTEAVRGTAGVLLSVAPRKEMLFSWVSGGRGLQPCGHRGRGMRSCKGEWPGRREGTSSASGAVTDSSPVNQETLYTEPWGTQVFVDFWGKTECKLDFKASVWLKSEAMGLVCCRLCQEKWLIANEFPPRLIIVVTHRSLA